MNKFKNSKKDAFLKTIIEESLESEKNDLITRCKFNFSYIDFSQEAGQSFENWSKEEIDKLLNKIKDYSTKSLNYWQNQRIGGGSNTVLEIYKKFPKNSDFHHPTYIPHEVWWARFRLESKVRLVGFILPAEYKNKKHPKEDLYYDCNTFYVVFLDKEHRFYKIDKK